MKADRRNCAKAAKRLPSQCNSFFGYTRFDGVESEFRGWSLVGGEDQRCISYFDDFVSPSSFSLPYCRIGARDEKGRHCNDPYSP